MDMSPITVQPKSTVLRLYSIFRGLGLRHLVVVDTEFCVAGIVTRNELTEHAFDDAGKKIDEFHDMQNKRVHGWNGDTIYEDAGDLDVSELLDSDEA